MPRPGRGKNKSVNQTPPQIVDIQAFLVFIFIGVAQNHRIAMFAGSIFYTADRRRENQIADIGNHQTDRVQAPAFQSLGTGVRLII